MRNTKAPAALSEASNLKDTLEELWFAVGDLHINQEADAINWAIFSYFTNEGIAIVRNGYAGGTGGEVIVSKYEDYECYDTDTVTSPYTTCWTRWEAYCLEAISPQWIDGHQRTFDHWAHLNFLNEPDEIYYDPFWIIGVQLFEDYHKYVAYFSGGPYSAGVVCPYGPETWHVAEQETIRWNVSMGADSSTWVYVYLDRNSGNDGYPEYLGCREAKLVNYLPWTVTGPVSAHCKMKVVAEDVAGNSSWDVSDFDFNITGEGNNHPLIDGHLQCKYPREQCNECLNWGDALWLEIEAHDPDGDSIYYEWYTLSLPSPGHFGNGYDTMTTTENCVEYFAPAKAKADETGPFSVFLKVTVVDVRGGSNDTTGWLGLYDPGTSCICGDVLPNGTVDSGDVIRLIGYVFLGESPPPDPIERCDVNNDCIINSGDVVRLIDRVFLGVSQCVCGWICPPESPSSSPVASGVRSSGALPNR